MLLLKIQGYNSQIGLPYSVLQIEPKHQIGIFEVGISQPLEMEKLAPIYNQILSFLLISVQLISSILKILIEKLMKN